jgi:hypothetical protein
VVCLGRARGRRPYRPERPGDDPSLARATALDRFIMTPTRQADGRVTRMDILRRHTLTPRGSPPAGQLCGRPVEQEWRMTAERID